MHITYDKEADAVYICFDSNSIDEVGIVKLTEEVQSHDVCVDYTIDGKIFGVELLGVSGRINLEELKSLTFQDV